MGRPLRGLILLLVACTARGADWPALDRFQQTITRAEFDTLLTNVYCPSGLPLTYGTHSVALGTNFTLRFSPAPSPQLGAPVLRHILLDPGHIGGEWARMEERWFQRGRDRPVQEAELNLIVARLLHHRLTNAGIAVSLTKTNFQPVSTQRPEDFRTQAEEDIPGGDDIAVRSDAVRRRQELLFYRSAEIAARARLANEQIRPDLTLCIHFNAVEWDQCRSLVEDNRLLFFVHGNYLPGEVADDAQRYRLFAKLLERSHPTELTIAESITRAFVRHTGLPAARYPAPVGNTGYVFARNLAANRLFDGPVVFLEPYYMNNRLVYGRIQLGDYDGEKMIEGKPYRSIFREYADAVFEGLQPFLATRQ